MQQIIRFTKSKVRREKVPSAEEVEEKRTNAFVETLRETLEKAVRWFQQPLWQKTFIPGGEHDRPRNPA